jgi:DUF4097 and DUF4098 domain-containing protein YvlB
MAAYPPPYSPKQQARAQRDAYRAQRDYWRAQRRPSLIRPLVLIAIGIIALLIEIDKINGYTFWIWYERWWPVVLIGIGVLALGEWWLERDQPYGGRRIGGGLVFLIIMLGLIGSATHGVIHTHGWQWLQTQSGDDDFGWHLFGQEHDADVTLDQAVPANPAVRIKNPHGDVTIATSTDGHIHVTARDAVYSSSDSDADKNLARLAPNLTVAGSDVVLEASDIAGAHGDLTINLPEGASLDIDAGHGDVSVQGTKGSVKVTSGHGDVKLDQIGGAVAAHMSKGDFSAHAIGSTVTVDGRMDDVNLTDIKSNVSLNGDFFGDMHLQALSAPLYLHSSRTEITIASVPGDLTLDSGDLNFKNVIGPVRVVTRRKDVEGLAVHGPTHIENNDGDVTLTVLAPLGDIDIHNDNGAIDLTLPAKTGFNLSASTNDGELSTDFDVSTNESDGKRTANGTVGNGGPHVTVVAEHGDVHIKKAGSVAASDSDDDSDAAPPTPPKPPKGPVRHLHSSTKDEPQPSVQ